MAQRSYGHPPPPTPTTFVLSITEMIASINTAYLVIYDTHTISDPLPPYLLFFPTPLVPL